MLSSCAVFSINGGESLSVQCSEYHGRHVRVMLHSCAVDGSNGGAIFSAKCSA